MKKQVSGELLKEQSVLVKQLIETIRSYNPKVDENLIMAAATIAIKEHGSQARHSGEPYYMHPFAVAHIIASMKLDISSIITALLHDVIEDTHFPLTEIERIFGNDIARLVDGVTKLGKIEYQPEAIRQTENFRKLILAMAEDVRVLLIKLADRLHNMRTLGHVKSPQKRLQKAEETLEIYAPLAERIGMKKIRNELQDISFQHINFEVYNSIVKRLNFLRVGGKDAIEKIVQDIRSILTKHHITNVEVYGREKTPYSIWNKMKRKNVAFEQLSDIVAFRIIVHDLATCYQVLGIIHLEYSNVPGSFKDFVSTPKENGYQSLHTLLITRDNHRIEVQIRTDQMHEIAEFGIAAHWIYKQGDELKKEGRQFRWVRDLLAAIENGLSTPEEFFENTKLEMYQDQVFCFTPKGQLVVLPKAATPLDFAYEVHSDLGLHCIGAKVNGRIVPLKSELHNGDQVEISTSSNHFPSPAWEQIVVTNKAKNLIRKFIKERQRSEYINLGKNITIKLFNAEKVQYNEDAIISMLTIFHKESLDDFYVAVGEGLIARKDIVNILLTKNKAISRFRKKLSFWNFERKNTEVTSVPVRGLIPGMAMHFANCCHPLPGDKIVGIVNIGKGVIVHTIDCDTLENYTDFPEKWIDVSWDNELTAASYISRIKIVISNEMGALATIASTIAFEKANIVNIKITSRSTDFFDLLIDIEVRDAKHISNIISLLKAKNPVHTVKRIKI